MNEIVAKINQEIKENVKQIDTDLISDTWHTFGELYKHRSILYIKLCKELSLKKDFWVFKTKKHDDESIMEGYFILGIKLPDNSYISYHMNNEDWDLCEFAQEIEKSPIKGKHTSNDTLSNLLKI